MDIKEIYSKLPTQENCIKHLENIFWGNIPKCPYCSSTRASKIKKTFRYHCSKCNTSFSVTTGTVFNRTHTKLNKWFSAIRLLLVEDKNISVRNLARAINVNRNTAFSMKNIIENAIYFNKTEILLKIIN